MRLSQRNRVLLVLIWLRTYQTYRMLASLFDISVSSVKDLVNSSIPVFDLHLSSYIQWPSFREWQELCGNWPKIHHAVGAVDGTSHKIYRPKVNQQLYYSGHRKYHCLHTQIIIDNTGRIRHVESGFPGHMNDAQHFRLMQRIPVYLSFPDNCVLLADSIYPNGYPILTTYSNAQLRHKQGEDLR